jgi:C-terminal processing protease CtpA/Prc
MLYVGAWSVQVTGLVPKGAAERSGAVKKGDLFSAVDGQDISSACDAEVAALCRGAPNTHFSLTLCKGGTLQEKLYQAARDGKDKDVKALLAAGALHDALFRGIVISRRK